MTATRYRFGAGGRFPLHRHEQEQFVYVVAGAIVFTIEGTAHRLTEGLTLMIPPMAIHEAEADTEGAEVVSVVTPPRTGADAIEILE